MRTAFNICGYMLYDEMQTGKKVAFGQLVQGLIYWGVLQTSNYLVFT